MCPRIAPQKPNLTGFGQLFFRWDPISQTIKGRGKACSRGPYCPKGPLFLDLKLGSRAPLALGVPWAIDLGPRLAPGVPWYSKGPFVLGTGVPLPPQLSTGC